MGAQPVPDWMVPPPEGFRPADLDRLSELPPHTELIDGSLILVSPQSVLHSLVIDLLVAALRAHLVPGYRVRREISVVLDEWQRPEPDVIVVRDGAETQGSRTAYPVETVTLAVEVVSPESEKRDRERKPQLYAHAGIEHFWRVELKEQRPVVYVYELDEATRSFGLTGIHHDRLTVGVPFAIDVDLTAVGDM
ncbi:Uma2 family endonuclease [Murinocardiopsis flavida]|uniref:Uma2 family endonuclease n=1 Tax=Murinocardiopsis flavida TaxID=645275 RepID=A0A2P8DUV1_9ACTN|nr:Uma2 family endonuclease [Murinocardiopsis flavida]PSL01009.1 Uma2 family endonuclease [Murinocardiopsis flavida]